MGISTTNSQLVSIFLAGFLVSHQQYGSSMGFTGNPPTIESLIRCMMMKNILFDGSEIPRPTTVWDVAINDMSPLNLVFLKVLAFGGRFETAAFAQGSPDGRMVTITSSHGFLPFVFGFCAQGLPVDFENPGEGWRWWMFSRDTSSWFSWGRERLFFWERKFGAKGPLVSFSVDVMDVISRAGLNLEPHLEPPKVTLRRGTQQR